MHIEPSIFKAYDIRGVFSKDIDAVAAKAIGKAFAGLLQKREAGKTFQIAVASDMRTSSPELKKSLIGGLLESGMDVIDMGMLSTPTFYFAVAFYGYDGGIQVSASHNPKEWNGFKVAGKNATPIGYTGGLNEMQKIIETDAFPSSDKRGTLQTKSGVVEAELEEQLKTLSRFISLIKPFKIVIDTANGMGAPDMKALFSKLPCKVEWMNEEPDGTFPAHPADPMVDKNTEDLRKRIVETGADLGIASDGDGDRYFFFDEKGEAIPQSIIRGIAAQIELKDNPGATILYDIRPGKITRDLIEEAGGKPILGPVGHSLIKERMLAENAIFGGESSGHFFYKLPYGTFEAPMLLVTKFLAYISQRGMPLSEIVGPYKRYFNSGEINTRLQSREQGLAVIEKIKKQYSDGKHITIDGLTVEYPDFWFNVRLSNTEPLIRLTLESSSKDTMEEKRDEILSIVTG